MKTNIKKVEEVTGISRQNIRYYEKQGLLSPVRNVENDYREYTGEDIACLQKIKLFRKLDMPLEEIRKVLQGECTLDAALEMQKQHLMAEQKRLSDALSFCGEIKETDIRKLDAVPYLAEMAEREKRGSVFADFVSDFKKVVQAEMEVHFSFRPENMCRTKAEFTESLFAYANENNLDLIITKEGLYPEFTLNGVEYTAERVFSRYGATVHCAMKHPEEAVPAGMSGQRYKNMKTLSRIAAVGLLIVYLLGSNLDLFVHGDAALIAVVLLIGAVIALPSIITYYNLK